MPLLNCCLAEIKWCRNPRGWWGGGCNLGIKVKLQVSPTLLAGDFWLLLSVSPPWELAGAHILLCSLPKTCKASSARWRCPGSLFFPLSSFLSLRLDYNPQHPPRPRAVSSSTLGVMHWELELGTCPCLQWLHSATWCTLFPRVEKLPPLEGADSRNIPSLPSSVSLPTPTPLCCSPTCSQFFTFSLTYSNLGNKIYLRLHISEVIDLGFFFCLISHLSYSVSRNPLWKCFHLSALRSWPQWHFPLRPPPSLQEFPFTPGLGSPCTVTDSLSAWPLECRLRCYNRPLSRRALATRWQ